MPADRLKFRCYQCTQLLAVSPSKAGSVVACPKCKTELLIPRTVPANVQPAQTADTGQFPPIISTGSSLGQPSEPGSGLDLDSLIPPEVASLRPEDLRIEAAAFDSVPYVPRVEAGSSGESRSSGIFLNIEIPTERAPAVNVDSILSQTPLLMPPPVPTVPAASPLGAAFPASVPDVPAPTVSPAAQPVAGTIPAIEIEPPSLGRPGAERRTVRAVWLPAAVVLAWSVFVLLALGMAFVAGILIGHFVWKPV